MAKIIGGNTLKPRGIGKKRYLSDLVYVWNEGVKSNPNIPVTVSVWEDNYGLILRLWVKGKVTWISGN
jgi:hypothetical protein